MIAADFPTIFNETVVVGVSSRHEGTVLDRRVGTHHAPIVNNRHQVCKTLGVNYDDCAFMRIIYSDQASYKLLSDIDTRSTSKHTREVVADGLFTAQKGVGMFLPVADCVATVVHDPVMNYIALLHLGRHSTLAGLMGQALNYFEYRGSNLSDVKVWMSPSAQRTSYKLEFFEYKDDPSWSGFFDVVPDGVYIDMQGYNRSVCLERGLKAENIEVSTVDTVSSADYFSHYGGDRVGRFGVVAMMR